jgi:hypothetical protein
MRPPPISAVSAASAAARAGVLRILWLHLVGFLLLSPVQFSPWLVMASEDDTEANGGGSSASPPNILLFIVDDLGWNQVGYHAKPSGNNEIPNIDAAAAAGIELNRGYVTPWYDDFYTCAGTRVSETMLDMPCGFTRLDLVINHDQMPHAHTSPHSLSLSSLLVTARSYTLWTGADRRGLPY